MLYIILSAFLIATSTLMSGSALKIFSSTFCVCCFGNPSMTRAAIASSKISDATGVFSNNVTSTPFILSLRSTIILSAVFDLQEREIFRQLIGVSGVGASIARMILSAIPPVDLQQVIVSSDVRRLKSVKGIGAKTAERIIVDGRFLALGGQRSRKGLLRLRVLSRVRKFGVLSGCFALLMCKC